MNVNIPDIFQFFFSPLGRSSPGIYFFFAPLFAILGAYVAVLFWENQNMDTQADRPTFWQAMIVLLAFYLISIWPLIAVTSRRAHDIGIPGPVLAAPAAAFIPTAWFTLLHLIPSGGTIDPTREALVKILMVVVPMTALFLLIIGLLASQPGPNKYGPNPNEVPQ